MSKLRVIITTAKGHEINFVSRLDLLKIPGFEMFFRPQTKNVYIIADGNKLEGK